jgi:arabinofuranosyltransferase
MNRRSSLIVLVPLVLATVLEIPFLRYVTDDTYIHMQFARNLMHGLGFSFNPGEAVYGFTSPLWVLLLAALGKLGIDLLAAAKILGQLFTWAGIGAVWWLAGEVVPSRAGRIAATLTWSANAWFLRWALSGMETSMGVFFVAAGMAAHLRERRRDGLPILSGFCWALAALSRPECLGLVPLAVLDLLLFAPSRKTRRVLVLVVCSGALLVPWGAYALRELGQYVPNSAYAKAEGFSLRPAEILEVVWTGARIVGATDAGEALLVLLAVAAALRRGRRAIRPWMRTYFLPVAWMVGLPSLYALRGTELLSRYLLPVLVPLVPFGFAALDAFRRYRAGPEAGPEAGPKAGPEVAPGRLRGLPFVASAVFILQNVIVLYGIALPPALSFTRGIEESLVFIGRWLRDNTPAEATVATADIGALGYFSDRKIIDLSGLITPEMIRPQRGMIIDEFVESFGFAAQARPDYLVDRYTAPDRFGERSLFPGVLEPILHRKMGPLGIMRTEVNYYTLYRIHWDRFDAARRDR